MNPLRFSPLHLLSLVLLLQVVRPDPLNYFCSNSKNYTSNSTYATNLNKLMDSLYHRVPPKGFGLNSVGEEPDRVYGLGLCRGDVSSSECKSCIADANLELRKQCPNDKEAIIWYDYCLLKYSYDDFFGKIDTKYIFFLWNEQMVSDPTTFNSKVRELLNHIVSQAYHSSKLYATRELGLGGSEKLHGLAQCTGDLSRASCKECLDNVISDLPFCCYGKQGGRVVGGSCNFRYEIYTFINS